MKRKGFGENRIGYSSNSIYGAPALESTLLLNTGGVQTSNLCIGALPSIPINASVSSGTRLFQYNKFFWNRDLYTFNFNNCAIMLCLSWYDGLNQIAYTMFYPVFLPQTTLTAYQSLKSNVTSSPSEKQKLIDDILYYLNGMWVPNPVANGPIFSKSPPSTGGFQTGPSFFTYRYKGFLLNPDNNIDFPFFQSGNNPPPLKWISINSNQNIALVKNPDYWYPTNGPAVIDYDCAFQIINPYSAWTLSSGNPTNLIQLSDGSLVSFLGNNSGSISSTFTNQGNSNHKGWCGRGSYSLGFGQNDDQRDFGAFTDIYGELNNPVLQDLWINYTTFVGLESGKKMDGVKWRSFVQEHFLSRYIVIAYFLPQFLPSRYITISSSILSRQQKLLTISNSPLLSKSNIIGVQFLTLDNLKTFTDNTLSGIGESSSKLFSSKNSVSDTPVLNMDPFNSIQSIDITISDEWNSVIQNYRSSNVGEFILEFSPLYSNTFEGLGFLSNGNFVCSYISGENSFILDNSGGTNGKMYTFPIPAWLSALNPLNQISLPPPSQQPLIAPFSTYNSCSLYMLFAYSSAVSFAGNRSVNVPVDFSPSLPYSANIIHFGRVLGF